MFTCLINGQVNVSLYKSVQYPFFLNILTLRAFFCHRYEYKFKYPFFPDILKLRVQFQDFSFLLVIYPGWEFTRYVYEYSSVIFGFLTTDVRPKETHGDVVKATVDGQGQKL